MIIIKKKYNTGVSLAKKGLPDFANAYAKFIEKLTINQSNKSLIVNYNRNMDYIAIEFNRYPYEVSVEELNSHLNQQK